MKTKVKGNMTAIVWKDELNVNILMNMHSPTLECNFCDEHGKTVKLAIMQDYNWHRGYMDKSDHVTNSYSIADGPGNGQISYTFSSGHYHCQHLYHFKLMVPYIVIQCEYKSNRCNSMQIFIHCKTTLHVSGVTAHIIRSIKNYTRSLLYRSYYLYHVGGE